MENHSKSFFQMGKLTARLMVIMTLSLGLLIPTMAIWQLTKERQERRDEVLSQSAASWGQPRLLGGPVLQVGGKNIIPENLSIQGHLNGQARHRGIFKIPFYSARLTLSGNFRIPANVQNARLKLYLAGARNADVKKAVLNTVALKLRGGQHPRTWLMDATVYTPLKAGVHTFKIELDFQGIQRLRFLPMAQKTDISLDSNWKNPNFSGSRLPNSRTINTKGFQATWSLSPDRKNPGETLARHPSRFSGQDGPAGEMTAGVDLFIPVDLYHRVERSLKYSILFIALTFLCFFMFEVFNPIRIHPLQYLFVGIALCVFYLLLLSFAEQIGFIISYLLASLATVGLISAYSLSILRSKTRALAMGGMLSGLYLFLFIILEAEAYSLLMGSVGLFAVLAVIMYATRNLNWYGLEENTAASS